MKMPTIFGLSRRYGAAPGNLHITKRTYPDSADTLCGKTIMCSTFFYDSNEALDGMSRKVETAYKFENNACADCLAKEKESKP